MTIQKKDVIAERCRREYYYFFKKAWQQLEPETELVDNWHIKYLCDRLQEIVEDVANNKPKKGDLLITIPPRSLKSSIVTIILNAWVWVNYPHIKFITASYAGDLAVEHSVKTRRLIESEWYQELFGDSFKMTTDQNVKSRFENSNRGSRRATSVGGSVTGSGADIIIADDPHKVSEVSSDLIRKSVIDWWTNTMYSRLNNQSTGVRIVVMQRLHEEDLAGYVIKGGDYEHICIPVTSDGDIKPPELINYYQDGLFFPRVFSRDVIEKTRKALTDLKFAGQYMQAPAPPEGNLIKEQWFNYYTENDIPEGLPIKFYTDGAYGKEESDNSATIAYMVHNNNLYIKRVMRWNLPFPSFISTYKRSIKDLGYDYRSSCYFEPKAIGISAVQQLKSEGINVVEDKAPTESKVSRVTAAAASIQSGKVYLNKNDNSMNELIAESVIFPNGKNDDAIDALASIIRMEMGSYEFVFVSNY